MYENVKRALDNFEGNLTLKDDYSEEFEYLDGCENDAKVLRRLGLSCRHIACSMINKCDMIVSWNFKHSFAMS